MKLLLQRVREARVEVDKTVKGQITQGLLVLVGIEKSDDATVIKRAAQRLLGYRVFADNHNKMNLNVMDVHGGVLAISQFTLAAQTSKGLRPSFSSAMAPEQAREIYELFIATLRQQYPHIETGVFGADMQVHLVNDGPVTFLLE